MNILDSIEKYLERNVNRQQRFVIDCNHLQFLCQEYEKSNVNADLLRMLRQLQNVKVSTLSKNQAKLDNDAQLIDLGLFKSVRQLELNKVDTQLIVGLNMLSEMEQLVLRRCSIRSVDEALFVPIHFDSLRRKGKQKVYDTSGSSNNNSDGSLAISPGSFEYADFARYYPRLRSLDLSYNCIQSLDLHQILAALPRLQSLNLSHNLIEFIVGDITQYTQLKKLDLSFNKLTRLDLSGECQLLSLSVGNNLIDSKSLLDSVQQVSFTELKHLDISNNLLTDLDLLDETLQLIEQHLESVNVMGNQVATMNGYRIRILTTLDAQSKPQLLLDGKNASITEKLRLKSRRSINGYSSTTSFQSLRQVQTVQVQSKTLPIQALIENDNFLQQEDIVDITTDKVNQEQGQQISPSVYSASVISSKQSSQTRKARLAQLESITQRQKMQIDSIKISAGSGWLKQFAKEKFTGSVGNIANLSLAESSRNIPSVSNETQSGRIIPSSVEKSMPSTALSIQPQSVLAADPVFNAPIPANDPAVLKGSLQAQPLSPSSPLSEQSFDLQMSDPQSGMQNFELIDEAIESTVLFTGPGSQVWQKVIVSREDQVPYWQFSVQDPDLQSQFDNMLNSIVNCRWDSSADELFYLTYKATYEDQPIMVQFKQVQNSTVQLKELFNYFRSLIDPQHVAAVSRQYKCISCAYQWSTYEREKPAQCPKCGNSLLVATDEDMSSKNVVTEPVSLSTTQASSQMLYERQNSSDSVDEFTVAADKAQRMTSSLDLIDVSLSVYLQLKLLTPNESLLSFCPCTVGIGKRRQRSKFSQLVNQGSKIGDECVNGLLIVTSLRIVLLEYNGQDFDSPFCPFHNLDSSQISVKYSIPLQCISDLLVGFEGQSLELDLDFSRLQKSDGKLAQRSKKLLKATDSLLITFYNQQVCNEITANLSQLLYEQGCTQLKLYDNWHLAEHVLKIVTKAASVEEFSQLLDSDENVKLKLIALKRLVAYCRLFKVSSQGMENRFNVIELVMVVGRQLIFLRCSIQSLFGQDIYTDSNNLAVQSIAIVDIQSVKKSVCNQFYSISLQIAENDAPIVLYSPFAQSVADLDGILNQTPQ
ncbi:hypothetical protein MIR68_007635 [Amoeboaphelidium protococcarum]|nr:hypothetical protein MIR68_007635 [Amoeboaphelidium protococcarum]